MLKRISILALVGFIGVVGCKSESTMSDKKMDTMAMDACSHCPGVQTMTADGKCPACGMAVNDMKMK